MIRAGFTDSKKNKIKFGLYYKLYYFCVMKTKIKKIESQYEVVINGESVKVDSLKDAENKMKSASMCEISISYITRKDFDEKGKLIEEYFVG